MKTSPKQFDGKLAVVTGGSSGIGLALAQQLASAGAKVVILARHADAIEAACQSIKINNPTSQVEGVVLDVSNADAVKQVFDLIHTKYGVPDLLFNCAGITHPGEFLELSPAIFRSMMEVDYFGTLYCIQAVTPGMAARGSGVIVNISSVVGYLNIYGYSAYGAAKFAVSGLTDSLRMELKPKGIQVVLVYPPDTNTPQLAYEQEFKPPVTQMLSSSGGYMQPETVATEILKGILRKRYIILPGFENKLINFATHLLGRSVIYSLLDRPVLKVLDRRSASPK